MAHRRSVLCTHSLGRTANAFINNTKGSTLVSVPGSVIVPVDITLLHGSVGSGETSGLGPSGEATVASGK
jgi:hypothetical protein